MNREDVSQGLNLIPGDVFVLAAADQEQKSAVLASFVQQACSEGPMFGVAVRHARPVRR